MKQLGGSIALICGILGIFAPFIDGFVAVVATQNGSPLEASGFVLGISALCSVVVMALAGLVLNRKSRFFGVLLIGFSVLGDALSVGNISDFLFWIAAFGGVLSLFGKRDPQVT